MRKALPLAVLLFFLFNTSGYYLIYKKLQAEIRQEIKSKIRKGLSERELTVISIGMHNANAIHWIKPGKEFIFKGELFDVVKISYKGQKKIFWCINDLKEKRLISAYTKARKNRNDQEKKLKKYPVSHFTLTSHRVVKIQSETTVCYSLYQNVLICRVSSPPAPPPKSSLFIEFLNKPA